MKIPNFLIDPDALAIPWCEGPFWETILEHRLMLYSHGSTIIQDAGWDINVLRTACTKFILDGYVTFSSEFNSEFLNQCINELDEQLMKEAVEVQAGHFHYNNGPRIFKAWEWNQKVLDIARSKKAMFLLEFLYARQPIPFQTINFKYGSNQPLHSDAIHFHTVPERWLCGYWTALEAVGPNNGALRIVPNSHILPILEFQELNMDKVEYGEEKEQYSIHEEYCATLGIGNSQEIHMQAGESIVWKANTIHGGSSIRDPEATRWSQATHVFFENCEQYYTPFYSNRYAGQYSLKDLTSRDLIKHVITEPKEFVESPIEVQRTVNFSTNDTLYNSTAGSVGVVLSVEGDYFNVRMGGHIRKWHKDDVQKIPNLERLLDNNEE